MGIKYYVREDYFPYPYYCAITSTQIFSWWREGEMWMMEGWKGTKEEFTIREGFRETNRLEMLIDEVPELDL